MNSLSGFNSQEIRRLHPYLSALLRRIEALEEGTGIGGTKIIWEAEAEAGAEAVQTYDGATMKIYSRQGTATARGRLVR